MYGSLAWRTSEGIRVLSAAGGEICLFMQQGITHYETILTLKHCSSYVGLDVVVVHVDVPACVGLICGVPLLVPLVVGRSHV